MAGVPDARGRMRPWWGMGDILLSLPVIFGLALLGFMIALPFVDFGDLAGELVTPTAAIVFSLYGQQLAQGGWPVLVSKWKGLGVAADWRLRAFRPVDLAIGLGTAIIALGAAGLAGALVSRLVGLTDPAAADNTQILTDADGTIWQALIVLAVVVGAPISEELFFRGLCLRSIEKRAGTVAGVIGSTVLFTLPHFLGAGWAATAVLFASIGAVGLVLAVVTVTVDRLLPAIIAHMLFNLIGALGALGTFDRFAP
ncbi:MAG: lysostaphin resistance A-like protein [Acidimicrobiales bacterium]